MTEDVLERLAATDRRQLVLIADKDDALGQRRLMHFNRAEDERQLKQIDHRGFLDDEIVERLKLARAGHGSEIDIVAGIGRQARAPHPPVDGLCFPSRALSTLLVEPERSLARGREHDRGLAECVEFAEKAKDRLALAGPRPPSRAIEPLCERAAHQSPALDQERVCIKIWDDV